MSPAMREAQVASSFRCDIPNLIVLSVTEGELAHLVLVTYPQSS